MNRALGYLGLAGLGVAGMYFLDPARGARRRGVVRDKLVQGASRSSESVTAAARDMAHRMQNMLVETRARVSRRTPRPHPTGSRPDMPTPAAQSDWSPALRLVTGGTGAALLGYCMLRRDRSITWLGLIGAGLLMRATADFEWMAAASGERTAPPLQAMPDSTAHDTAQGM